MAAPALAPKEARPIDPERPSVENCVFERVLDRGGQAVVWRGTYRGIPVAVKINTAGAHASADWRNEVAILKSIGRPPGHAQHHPNVLCVVAAGEGWIALRFAAKGNLVSYAKEVGAMEAPDASALMRGVVSGLRFLHNSGFIHRDMKPGNVLLDADLTPWLSDFGFACERENPPKAAKLGTPPYMAPEIIAGTPYDETVDTYAIGVMLWELLAGQVPYQRLYLEELPGEVNTKIYELVSGGQRPEPLEAGWGDQVVSLIKRCWDQQPRNRPSLEIVLRELTAP